MRRKVYRKILKAQHSMKRRKEFCSAMAAADNAKDGASLLLLSKAALVYGTDQLVRALAGPRGRLGKLLAGDTYYYAGEAKVFLNLAANCGPLGMQYRLALCAVYNVEVIGLVGPAGIQKAELHLRELTETLLLPDRGSDPSAELPPADPGAVDGERGASEFEEMVSVRGLWVPWPYCHGSLQLEGFVVLCA